MLVAVLALLIKSGQQKPVSDASSLEPEKIQEVPQQIQRDPEIGAVVQAGTQAALKTIADSMKKELDENTRLMLGALKQAQTDNARLREARQSAPVGVGQLQNYFGAVDEDGDGTDVDSGMTPLRNIPSMGTPVTRLARQTSVSVQPPLSPQRSFKAMVTVPEGAQEGDFLNIAPPPPLAEFLSGSPKRKQFNVSIPKGVYPGDELLIDVTWEKDRAIAVVSPAKHPVPNHERGQTFLELETVNRAGHGIFGRLHEQSPMSANELESFVSTQRKIIT